MNNTLGQITDEIRNAVKNFHIASMGDDRRELDNAQAEYLAMITLYGKDAVQLVVDDYNETVIAKAK